MKVDIKNTLKIPHGFSLLEVLIAMTILGTVTLGVMQFSKSSSKLAKRINQDTEIFRMVNRISMLLRNEKICDATLANKSPHGNGSTISQIKYKDESGKAATIQINKEYGEGSGKFKISSMKIKSYQDGTSIFEVEFVSKDAIKKIRQIAVNTNLTSNKGNIKDCMSDKDNFLSGFCQTLDGDFTDLLKCKSISVQTVKNETPAISTEGNLIINDINQNSIIQKGDLTVHENITSKHQTVEGDLKISNTLALGPKKEIENALILGDSSYQTKISGQSSNIFNFDILNKKEDFFKVNFSSNQFFQLWALNNHNFRIESSLKRIKLEGFSSQLDTYDYTKSRSKEKAESGFVATRLWIHNYIKALLDPTIGGPVDKLVETALDQTAVETTKALTIVKTFAKKICGTYFRDTFKWDDSRGCYPIADGTINEECSPTPVQSFLFYNVTARNFQCKKFPDIKCKNEISFSAWENWWNNANVHYRNYHLAPLYMTHGSWKLCSEVQFIHDGSAVNIGSEPNPLDPGSDTVDKPDNPVAEKCGDKDPCELKSSTALNDTTRKSEDTKFVEDYTSCLLKPENYCGPLKSKSGCHEEIKKAGDSTESTEAVKTFGYSAFGCSSSADDIKVCHSSQPKCVECNQSSHCGWKTVNKKCKTSNNTCVQCTQDSHCPSINNSLKGCTSNNVCVACTKSSHCGSSKVCKTSNSSYTCVQCTNDSDCGSGKKCKTATNTCYSVNTNQPVNWNQTSKVSCGGNKSAKSCCQNGGKKAITVQDIEKDTSGFKTRCKKNTQPFESWAIFKVDGGKVDGKGYGCNLTKGSSGGAGNALCH